MRVKSKNQHLTLKGYIDQLASGGRHHFTSADARKALGVSANATKQAINRLNRQGLVASPARGYYVILPPEYRSLKCLPADQFIPALMESKKLQYYAGLLTAAQFYGAAHQRPQEFQVILAKNRRPIKCGKVNVKFTARKNIAKVAVQTFNTNRGQINVSTPESTAIDLAGYPQHAGGLDNVATILAELSHELDPEGLVVAASTAPVSWAQRLGYLLEFVDASESLLPLKKYVMRNAREYTKLVPGSTSVNWQQHKTWKLEINSNLDPDL